MDKLLFGTAGIPLSTPRREILNGIRHLSAINLDGLELEFVRSVNISKENAPKVKKAANMENKLLTCHGQYYINLSSLENEKIEASKERILNAARIANLCGAWSMTFHAGFYQKQAPKEVYGLVRNGIREIVETLKQENNRIWIRPETTGKPSQFGTIDEILKLSAELEQVMPCIDFSHLHARSIGRINTFNEFSHILSKVEDVLGRTGIKNMHIHVSGIAYGDKGEKNHLTLNDSDFNYRDLMRALKDFSACGIIISESPNIEDDAILMKRAYYP